LHNKNYRHNRSLQSVTLLGVTICPFSILVICRLNTSLEVIAQQDTMLLYTTAEERSVHYLNIWSTDHLREYQAGHPSWYRRSEKCIHRFGQLQTPWEILSDLEVCNRKRCHGQYRHHYHYRHHPNPRMCYHIQLIEYLNLEIRPTIMELYRKKLY